MSLIEEFKNGKRYGINWLAPTIQHMNNLVQTVVDAEGNSSKALNTSDSALDTAKKAEEKIEQFIKTEGNTAVTIGGVPQTTWSADFAESERQKTLNLCYLKSGSHSNYGVSAVYNAETQTITLTGTATTDADIMYNSRNILPNISNMAGKTVTASFYVVSGSYSGHFRSFLGTYDNSNIWADRFQVTNFENGDLTTHHEGVYIPNNLTYDTLMFYCHGGTTFNNLVLKVQFVEGEARDEWRYPYGAIVHENDIEDVEHIETRYDKNSSDSNINWGYTSGIQLNGEVTGKDFSKYKKLNVYLNGAFVNCIIQIDLTTPVPRIYKAGYSYYGGTVVVNTDAPSYILKMAVLVSTDKTSINFYICGYQNVQGGGAFNNAEQSEQYAIYKIEGVF